MVLWYENRFSLLNQNVNDMLNHFSWTLTICKAEAQKKLKHYSNTEKLVLKPKPIAQLTAIQHYVLVGTAGYM